MVSPGTGWHREYSNVLEGTRPPFSLAKGVVCAADSRHDVAGSAPERKAGNGVRSPPSANGALRLLGGLLYPRSP